VWENPVIKGVRFEGNTVFTDEELLSVMQTKPGEVMNSKTIVTDAAAIEKKYADAGYAFARVMDLNVEESTGTLVITIAEGTVEEIRVRGNTKTHSWVIKQGIRTKPGDIVNTNRLKKDLQRLVNTELFEDVTVEPELGTKPGYIILNFKVVERKSGMAAVGVGYSSVQRFVGFIDYAEANLKGTAQRISARAEFGGRDSIELGWFDPFWRPNDTSLNVGLYNKLVLREAFQGNVGFLYDERRTGGNVTVSRPLSESTRVFYTLRSDEVSASQTGSTPLPPDVALLQSATVRSVASSIRKDTRDIIMDPTRGEYNSLSVEVAGLIGGGSRFNKYGTDLRRYWRAGKKNVVASRLLLGFTTGDPPYLEQFLLGGGETLRGYRNDRFPGRNMALLNTEFRFPLGAKIKGVLFVDVGDAWQGAFAETFGDKTFKPHVGYGVGVRVVTPIGPLRLDYGIGEFGNETHFSVGHVF
jgi:outer membrane protein insertion porin family